MPSAKKAPELLSIGELAASTGVSPDTIRVWERRYGAPKPVRLASGHRRYTPEQLRWLRRVVEAVAAGHRPGSVVPRGDEELERLLERQRAAPAPAALDEWIALIRGFDSPALAAALRADYERHGAGPFVSRTCVPLLSAVGRAWADGRLEIRHEHFLTELLHDLLRGARLTVGAPGAGPSLLLCTLEQDMHDLPVQMAALIAAQMGVRVRLLGRDTPLDQVLTAAREMAVDAVCAPVPLVLASPDQERLVLRLRAGLPEAVELCVGWQDARFARRPPRGVTIVRELGEYELWLRELLRPRGFGSQSA